MDRDTISEVLLNKDVSVNIFIKKKNNLEFDT